LDPQAVIGVQQGLRSLVPLAQEDQRALLATSVPDNGIAGANPWSFRFFINAKTDASTIAEYAYDELGVRRAAVIYVNDNMGNSYHTEFKDSFEGFGGQLVASETFSPGQANHRTQIQKIKQANPGAVYLVGYGKSLSTLPGQLREANVDATLLSVGTVSQPEIMKAAGEAANGIYYTTSKFSTYNPQNPELKRFVSRYKERHGETPVFFEVFGYDSLRLLLMAARQGGVQPEELRKGLTNVKDASLAVGDISVAKDQDVRFPVVVRRIMDGEWVPVEQSEESKETAQQTSE
jgi:branched-chain amino acid transport system substrate-binding protein